jgi:hypothetical protein
VRLEQLAFFSFEFGFKASVFECDCRPKYYTHKMYILQAFFFVNPYYLLCKTLILLTLEIRMRDFRLRPLCK